MAVKVVNGTIPVQSKGFNDIIDITIFVREFVEKEKLVNGQLLVFINGSTAAISTIEYEPGLLQDLPAMLEKIAPMHQRYRHDDTWHDGNGYAHLRSTLIGPSFTVPVAEGRLVLGTWQQIILIDFDNSPRHRSVFLQFVGETASS
ncbi:MAG TPA: YjbQ family protein [Caldithrix abyssi]|uniref:YjbQ family protein n=1 Tax=Caldithrix abyssi TaxID=187145 RepID=A0A7V4U0J9_CALAY|nr:YjbQ family protein [Caldithrix abyssi]